MDLSNEASNGMDLSNGNALAILLRVALEASAAVNNSVVWM
jgi:hypothetical protein